MIVQQILLAVFLIVALWFAYDLCDPKNWE